MGSDPMSGGDSGGPTLGSPASLVFVGGTGRSGTHILGRLLGSHAHFADVPIESRFHCNKRGIGDLLEGRVTLTAFMDKLRGFWWHRVRVDDQPRGLYNLMRQADFDTAADRFERGYHDEPVTACRQLFDDLLWPVAALQGKPGLVEMSSHNIKEAQTLRRLFPAARHRAHRPRRARRRLVGDDQDVGPGADRAGDRLVGRPAAGDRRGRPRRDRRELAHAWPRRAPHGGPGRPRGRRPRERVRRPAGFLRRRG